MKIATSRAHRTRCLGAFWRSSCTLPVVLMLAFPLVTRQSFASDSSESVSAESSSGDTSDSSQEANNKKISEVIVTAQKREERIQDVPVPVTALDTEQLVETAQVRFADYYSKIPSLTFTPDNQGSSDAILTIRGLNSNGGNPTVAILVDGLPFGSASVLGAGYSIPDLDPADLDRIEVLRGPQGTLYGASSIGGVINFVTAAPSTEALKGRVEADYGTVTNGDGPNAGIRGSVNIPISDTLAVRASAFTRQDAGYVDDVQNHEQGVNWADATGGRVALGWHPSDVVSLQLSAVLQDYTRHGSSTVFIGPGYGDLQQDTLPESGWTHSSIQDYAAVLKFDFGTTTVTSLTSYNINLRNYSFDYTSSLDPYLPANYGTPGVDLIDFRHSESVNEELRLETKLATWLDWMLGGFFTHQHVVVSQNDQLTDPVSGVFDGTDFADLVWHSTYREYAAFTDFTIHFTSKLGLQLGGRESFQRQYFLETDAGPFVEYFEFPGTQPAITDYTYPSEISHQSVFTYLASPQYRFSDDLMVYARVASGFRSGGPNPNDLGSTLAQGEPPTQGSDTTKNYELGAKGDSFHHMFTYDASIYYIDWKNPQLTLLATCGCLEYGGNGARAESEGVEVSVEARPVQGLVLSTWGSWNNAHMTEPIPGGSAYGPSGSPLPFRTRFSGNFTVEENFPLTAQMVGFVGGTLSYIGQRVGFFMGTNTPQPPRTLYPAYAKTDLHAGLKLDDWTFSAFANNVADKRGELSGGPGNVNPESYIITPPRTIGISVIRSF